MGPLGLVGYESQKAIGGALPKYCVPITADNPAVTGGAIVIATSQMRYVRAAERYPVPIVCVADSGPHILQPQHGRQKFLTLSILYDPDDGTASYSPGKGCASGWQEVTQRFSSRPAVHKKHVLLESRLVDARGQPIESGVYFRPPAVHAECKPLRNTQSYDYYPAEDCYKLECCALPMSAVHIPDGAKSRKVIEDVIPALLEPHLELSDAERSLFEEKTMGALRKVLPPYLGHKRTWGEWVRSCPIFE